MNLLEKRLSSIEDKFMRMSDRMDERSCEMTKYFRRYNQLHQKIMETIHETITNYSKAIIIKFVQDEGKKIDFVKEYKGIIDQWFTEQFSLLSETTTPLSNRMDKIEQDFLDYIRYFEKYKTK